MNDPWDGGKLLEPVSAEAPCGSDLEDTDALGAFDAYQLFGQDSLEAEPGEARKHRPPDWIEVRDRALETLQTSKDLRLLAHLGAALLRTDGVPAFAESLRVASQWLDGHWQDVYPRVDEDAVIRQNALNCFADHAAVIDGLRRAYLVSSRLHGRFSLRDIEIAAGQLTPTASDEEPPDAQRISAAFAVMPIDELRRLQEAAAAGVKAVRGIEETMRREAGDEAVPTLEPLSAQLSRLDATLKQHLATHPEGAGAEDGGGEGEQAGGTVAVGAVRSRQDAIRALDAVAEFFRRNEPSSPIPLFLERAKRLVSKDFLEVLADVVPDALADARRAGGVRDD